MKKYIFYMLTAACLLLAGCAKTSYLMTEDEVSEVDLSEEYDEKPVSETCYVQVAGAVRSPGVYEMESGQRVYEAIELAGGLLEEAEVSNLNQALPISDGQMIQIYTKGQLEEKEALDIASGKVNINKADEKTLMTLPGIGESKALSIVAYRDEHGEFSSIEDIKQITGIKDGVYNRIKDSITVGY